MTKALELAKFGRETPPTGVVVGDSDAQTLSSKTFSDMPVFSSGTTNTVPYLNASKVFSTSATFVFDGTNLGIGTANPAYKLQLKDGAIGVTSADGTVTSIINYNSLGTVTNSDFVFNTNSIERARISSTGLQVTGALSATGTTTIGNGVGNGILVINGQAANSRAILGQTVGTNRWIMYLGNPTAETGSDAGSNFQLFAVSDAGAGIDSPIIITRASGGSIALGGTSNRPVTSTGNVGIGTSNAEVPLTIKGGTNTAIKLISDASSGTTATLFGSANAGVRYGTLALSRSDTSAITTLISGDPTDTSYFASNVGIGTASPSYKLEVVAGTSGQQSLAGFRTADATAANNAGLMIFATPSATATSRSVVAVWDADGANSSGGDYFLINKNGNSGSVDLFQYSNAEMKFAANYIGRATVDMTLSAAGNLGLGTTPSTGAKFQVTGYTDFWNTTNTLLRVQHDGSRGKLQSYTGGAVGNIALNPDGGNVGVGRNDPQFILDVNPRMRVGDGTNNLVIGYWDSVTNRIESSGKPLFLTSYTDSIRFGMSGSENMRLDSSGALYLYQQGAAAYGALNLVNADAFIRLNSTGGTADKMKWDIRAISSTGAEALEFRTINDANTVFSTKLWIAHGGNVGIGNTNPAYKLHVTGTIGVNSGYTSGNFGLFVQGQGAGSADARAAHFRGFGGHTTIGATGPTIVLQNADGTTNNITKLSFETASNGEAVSINCINTDHGNFYGDMAFNTRGSAGYSEKLRIKANGNVGIGTDNPTVKLEVNGEIKSAGIDINQNNNLLYFTKTGGSTGTSSNNTHFIGRVDSAGYHVVTDGGTGFASIVDSFVIGAKGSLILGTSTPTTAYTTGRVIIDQTGNVGIGTRDPTEKLHVRGIATGNGAQGPRINLQYSGTSGDAESLVNFLDFRGNVNAAIGNNLEDDSVGNYAARLVFKTAVGGTLYERMRINSAGYVTTPNQPSWCLRPNSGGNDTASNSYVGWTSNTSGSSSKACHITGVTLTGSVSGIHNAASSGRLTVPVAGKYKIWVSIRGENMPGSGNLYIDVNGANVARQHVEVWGPTYGYPFGTTFIELVLNLSANDYIETRIACGGLVVAGFVDNVNWFAGHLIG